MTIFEKSWGGEGGGSGREGRKNNPEGLCCTVWTEGKKRKGNNQDLKRFCFHLYHYLLEIFLIRGGHGDKLFSGACCNRTQGNGFLD